MNDAVADLEDIYGVIGVEEVAVIMSYSYSGVGEEGELARHYTEQ